MSSRRAARRRSGGPPVFLTPSQAFALALGRTIRALRARRRLSQEALGYRANLHRNYVGCVERAETNPNLGSVTRLLVALGIPMHEVWNLFVICHSEVRRDARAGRIGIPTQRGLAR
ncbi:helix-turn-helix transcriptional regulator [Conexibacter sp. JD483]|uniref:helix-turn-helix domain-containing protein n=1 Tax=unclassified Conexibacter TaxID=2627773 RepID=UPI002721D11F|nr:MULTISPECIES: helix-turn-helix transcriptional regulator [unclassified Conexibacter]MDO8184691.1 helix-turn-helix transcriptional regulator [Conexibacter sp. CPCC 205706]MDO8197997.1 helix-turn-helix transcriptional regulator [Conexibacter sp. CPCC 205762]MDR9368427.1 helix-turn-helix transcriptional regulator [Conexibacter sp. JD483]